MQPHNTKTTTHSAFNLLVRILFEPFSTLFHNFQESFPLRCGLFSASNPGLRAVDCSIVRVRQQREKRANRVKERLKAESGCRDVDIHPDAALILRNFIDDRKCGFLFQSANGTMVDPRSIGRNNLDLILKQMGRDQAGTLFNVFRRFREAVLQRSEVRQILIDYWMGHSNPSMGDRYGKQLVEDVNYRQDQIK